MTITISRSRLRPEHAAEYATLAAKMNVLVQTMPGYVSHKTFTAEDGARVTIVSLETMEAQLAWAEHPHHREGWTGAIIFGISRRSMRGSALIRRSPLTSKTPFGATGQKSKICASQDSKT